MGIRLRFLKIDFIFFGKNILLNLTFFIGNGFIFQ